VTESPSIIESIVATIGKLLMVNPGFGKAGFSIASDRRPVTPRPDEYCCGQTSQAIRIAEEHLDMALGRDL